jgi:hypothetical protein
VQVVYTLMENILQLGAPNKSSAPSGAQLNAVDAFVPAWAKWLAGKRPENFNCWLSMRAPEGRKIPTPGTTRLTVIR